MENVRLLYNRLIANPVTHLGRKSVDLIPAYELGYELSLQRWERPLLRSELSIGAFQDWVEKRFCWTKEMGCRQNVVSFARLLSIDDQAAFDFYFELYEIACGEICEHHDRGVEADAIGEPLVQFILSENFRNRAGLYFGSRSLNKLWAMCSGYFWAEKDLAVPESEDQRFFIQFQAWLESRYRFARECPWNRILNFLYLNQADRAWTSFYDLLEMFIAGEGSDSLSKNGKLMLASITKAIMAQDQTSTPNEIKKVYEDTIKHISPA